MEAVFRADMSFAIGSGHVSRCLTLAGALAARGVSSTFAMHAPSDAARAWVAREGHSLAPLAVLDDVDEVLALAARDGGLVVVDSYLLGHAYTAALRGAGRIVAVFDDLASAPLRADVVLNGNLYAEELTYDVERGTRLLLGPRYALVRDQFLEARRAREAAAHAPREGGPSRVFVTMGGADPTCETESVIASLAASDALDGSAVRVVVGPANPRLETIRAAALAATRLKVEVLGAVDDMATHMTWCDVAVSAAGGTCLELACVGVAAAVVVVADNQRLVGDALARRGLMEKLEGSASAGAPVAALLANEPRRRAMEAAQRDCVDGLGKDRVADALNPRG